MKSHSEYWLKMGCNKMSAVECATEASVPSIEKLKQAISQAEEQGAQRELVGEAKALRSKLEGELEVTRAMDAIPDVRLPSGNVNEAKDYFNPEQDQGHIQQTEEFPLLPADAEEYKWVSSPALTSLRTSSLRLQTAISFAEGGGANEVVVLNAKEAQKKVSQSLNELEAKNEDDKEAAVVVAEKAAKKLKKKHKKKK
eukprot:FR738837.1.p1 GENE.FR738837.1~~FR738837.1.p1  ORF type:complete len:229 (+),score=42.14 FR738837.1:96-689(+)